MNRLTLRALALIAGAAAAAAGCTDGSRTPTATEPAAASYQLLRRTPDSFGPRRSESGTSSVSGVIGPAGGTLQLGDGYRIDFPAGALAQPTTITMTPSDEYVGVELEPHGIRFPWGHEPVLTLRYSSGSILSLLGLRIAYTDDSDHILEILPSLWQPFSGSVTARLHHFSGYVIAGS
jgi:hypothetical protein